MSTACNHDFKDAEKHYDIKGIFLTATCDKCRKARLSVYRPSVLDNDDQISAFGKVLHDHDKQPSNYTEDY